MGPYHYFIALDITSSIHTETADFVGLPSFSLASMVSLSSAEQVHMLQQNEDPRFSIKSGMTPLFIVSATFYNLIVRQGLVKQKIKCKHISVQ